MNQSLIMKFEKCFYESFLSSCPYAPPEIGGILGGKNSVVTDIVIDNRSAVLNKAVYIPDIDFLNFKIDECEKQNIEFFGIFHTHISNNTLSNDDRINIEKVMCSMPKSIIKLYFPIVIPKKEMIAYVAERKNNKINIYLEDIDIIEDKEV